MFERLVEKRDAWWWHKSNAAAREAIARGAMAWRFDSLVVTEYPKSGGTWLSQMIGEATGLEYPRNRYPVLHDSVLHGCWLNPSKKHRTVVLFRDGRDVMTSYYFHLVYPKAITSAKYSDRVREKTGVIDPTKVEANLERFIEWAFTEGFPGWTWADFVDRWWDDRSVVATSYERLTSDPRAELCRILDGIQVDVTPSAIDRAVDRFSFSAQSGRERGDSDDRSFVRKGIVGDWENHFSISARKLFDELAGDQLVLAGYAPDRGWIDR